MARRVQMGAGCLFLFALPFAGLGILSVVMGVRGIKRGEPNAWVAVAVGALFTFVGLALMGVARFAGRKQVEISAAQEKHPNEPWMQRADWAAGEVKSSDKQSLMALWFFAIFWNAISGPLTFFLPKKIQEKGEFMLYLFFIFPIIGMFLLVAAIRGSLRYRRFGTSTFKMLSVPGEVGGTLTGVIQTQAKVHAAAHFDVSLRCIHRVTTGSGRNRRTVEHVLWEDRKLVKEMTQDDARRSGIPVLFQIPGDVSPTDSDRNISWQLKASADIPGVDFETAFEVPVFTVSAPKGTAINAAQFAERYEEPLDFAKALAATGVNVRTDAYETEVSFAAARNKAAAVIVTLLALGGIGAAGLVLKPGVPGTGTMVWAGLTTLFLFLSTTLWTSRSRVRADEDQLEVTRHWLFRSSRKLLPAASVQSIKTTEGMTSGNTHYYHVTALTADGKTVRLGQLIRGQREAEWVADHFRRVLRKK